jgi:hypothetical protein
LAATNSCGDVSYRHRFFDYCGAPICYKRSEQRLSGIWFNTADEGIGNSRDSLFRTFDGGSSWEYITAPLSINQMGAIFFNSKFQKDGYGVVLVLNDINVKSTYVTKDGGEN